jgi:hypothetical protein
MLPPTPLTDRALFAGQSDHHGTDIVLHDPDTMSSVDMHPRKRKRD